MFKGTRANRKNLKFIVSGVDRVIYKANYNLEMKNLDNFEWRCSNRYDELKGLLLEEMR